MAGGLGSEPRGLRVRTGSAVVVLGLIAVSVTSSPALASTARPGSETSGIAWGSCDPPGAALQCARVAVPLDWDHPNGKQIELSVIRHLASQPNKRIGSLFMDPGGPGLSGVEFVRDNGPDLDEVAGGRFDVVGWDPRGTNRSSLVQCFTSDQAAQQFWAGVSIPTTRDESQAYQRKTVELAQRCGQVSGDLLAHISTADTARDLDELRRLVGDDKLTYVGLSYGTMIGQIYVNLFPDRVRAMVLDGLVDAVEYTTSAETRVANQSSAFDAVLAKFVELCQNAGPGRCALAGHGNESVAQRVAQVFAKARETPIPAPRSVPPGALDYSDLLVASFNPLRLPGTWPKFAEDLRRRRQCDGVGERGACRANSGGVRRRHDVGGGVLCRRGGPPALAGLAERHPEAHRREQGVRTGAGMVAVGAVRVELAGTRHRSIRRTVGRQDPDPHTPVEQQVGPGHQPPELASRRTAARQRRPADRERLRPLDLEHPQ